MATRCATGDDAHGSLLASACLTDARWGDIQKGKLDTGRFHRADLLEAAESVRTLRGQLLMVAETAGRARTGFAAHDQVGEISDRPPILTEHIVGRSAQSVPATWGASLENSSYTHPGAPKFDVYHAQEKLPRLRPEFQDFGHRS